MRWLLLGLVMLAGAALAADSPASQILREARRAIEAKSYDRAIELLTQAEVLDPASPEVPDLKGVVFFESGRVEDAEAAFRGALARDSRYASAHYHLGLVARSRGQTGKSVRFLEEAIGLDRDFTEAKYALSNACRELGDIDGTIEMLQQVVASRRAFGEARYNLALALSATGKRQQEALRELLIAAAIQPDAAPIRIALGQLYSERNDHQRAIDELHRAVALIPFDPDAHYNLGLSYRLAGRLDEADAEFRRALELNPRHGPSHKARGLVLRQQGNYSEARSELESASSLMRDDAEVRQVLGAVLIRLGELEPARERLREAVKLNPVLYESWYQLSQVEQKLGSQEAARQARDEGKKAELLKRRASESLVRYQIAEERLAKTDKAGAIAALREAVQLSPEFSDGAFRLAELLAETNGSDAEGRSYSNVFSKSARRILEREPSSVACC